MGPKCPKWVHNGSKTGPKRGPKGGPKWVPQRSEPKKSRKIFFLWPQSTKKVTHVPVFEEKKIIFDFFFEKKIISPYRWGCSTLKIIKKVTSEMAPIGLKSIYLRFPGAFYPRVCATCRARGALQGRPAPPKGAQRIQMIVRQREKK